MQSNISPTIKDSTMKIATLSTLLLSFALSTSALASGNQGQSPFGAFAPNGTAMRTLTVTSETKWLNVKDGETVRFDVNGKKFEWTFNLAKQREGVVPFSKIVPDGVHAGKIAVYVAPNPRYIAG
jgi:hypothetical protein